MVCLEMLPREGDQFAIGQMIETFDTNDSGHQLRAMMGDVFDQLGLGLSGAGNQHRAGVGDGQCDFLKVAGIDSRVTAADGVGLMMDMTRRTMRVNDKSANVGDIEMKDPGFQVVEPDDRMIVTGHQHPFPIAVAQSAE